MLLPVFVRYLVMISFTARRVLSSPTPPWSSPAGESRTQPPGRDGLMQFPAKICLNVCQALDGDSSPVCVWKEVTPSSAYEQKDSPEYFGKILATSLKADTQGWHYRVNASTCRDLFLQTSVGARYSYDGLRVGCVCSYPSMASEHLLCAYDLPTKGYHHPRVVLVAFNKSACSVDSLSVLSSKTGKSNSPGTLSNVTSREFNQTQNASTTGDLDGHPDKDGRLKKIDWHLAEGLIGGLLGLVTLGFFIYFVIKMTHVRNRRNSRNAAVNLSGRVVSLTLPENRHRHLDTRTTSSGTVSLCVKRNDSHVIDAGLVTDGYQQHPSPCQKPMATEEHTLPEYLCDHVPPAVQQLTRYHNFLVENLSLDDLPLNLLQKDIITKSDYEEVRAQSTERGRGRAVKALLEIMLRPEKLNDVERFLRLLDLPEDLKQNYLDGESAEVHLQANLLGMPTGAFQTAV